MSLIVAKGHYLSVSEVSEVSEWFVILTLLLNSIGSGLIVTFILSRLDENIPSPEISWLIFEGNLGVTAFLLVDSLNYLCILVSDVCHLSSLSDFHLFVLHKLQKILPLFICYYSVSLLLCLENGLNRGWIVTRTGSWCLDGF